VVFKPFNKSTRPESGLLTARIRRGCEISIAMVDYIGQSRSGTQVKTVGLNDILSEVSLPDPKFIVALYHWLIFFDIYMNKFIGIYINMERYSN